MMNNKIRRAVAVLLVGLLLFLISLNGKATEEVGEVEELYFMPTAGFEEFLEETPVPEPIEDVGWHEIETYDEPIAPLYLLTDREVDLLLRIGVLEGGKKDVVGIAHVMQVVMNRVESDQFPNTVEEVIFQKNPVQFTTADKLAKANITPEAYAALDQVIFGDYQSNGACFFESCDGLIFNSWADYAFSYGGHDFYNVKET